MTMDLLNATVYHDKQGQTAHRWYRQITHSSWVLKGHAQGRWKQSADGQAQLDVGGEAANNLRMKRTAKIWTYF